MNSESLLLIDDDSAFLKVAGTIITRKGFNIETAASAGEALSKFKEHSFNIAILDISLPDMDGTELLPQLLQISPDTPVIMLTGHSSINNAVKSINSGAFAYLEKPVNPDNLLAVINRGLEKQRLQTENKRLLKELEARHRESHILLTVTQHVSHSLDLREIITAASEELTSCLSLGACQFYLMENGILVLKHTRGISPAEENRKVHIENLRPYLDEGVPVNIDLSKDGKKSIHFQDPGLSSYTVVPLKINGENIGAIGMGLCSSSHSFTDKKELLAGIGREIAIAIKNAQLYEEASSARALRELDALRTELLANVSHELRTPLSAIKGYSSALLQPDIAFDQPTLREFLQTIDKEADRLGRLISDLLIMSRLDSGTLVVKKKKRYIHDIVENIRDNLFNLTNKHKLKISIPEDLPPVIVDDQIGAVLTNLVENAVKYSPEGSCITVSATMSGSFNVLCVQDEGTGIPQTLQEKIFERFYQITDSRDGHRPGTGLGLSICKGIVETHGGRIWVESEQGKGSKFYFSLPYRLE